MSEEGEADGPNSDSKNQTEAPLEDLAADISKRSDSPPRERENHQSSIGDDTEEAPTTQESTPTSHPNDDKAEGNETSSSTESTDSEAPLSNLRNQIQKGEQVESKTHKTQDSPIGGSNEGTVVDQLLEGSSQSSVSGTDQINDRSEVSPQESIQANPPASEVEQTTHLPQSTILIHTGLTIVFIVLAIVIYASAVVGLIPQFFWIISLPFFAFGVFGLVPLVAWLIGYWDPKDIQ